MGKLNFNRKEIKENNLVARNIPKKQILRIQRVNANHKIIH